MKLKDNLKTIYLLVYFLMINYLHSQINTLDELNKTIVPPNVYEYTKYGDKNINQYSGQATVKITLTTVNTDAVSIPLELEYYTGGIKANEEANFVGLGWSMHLPVIIQTVRGFNDFCSGVFFQKLPPFQGSPIDGGSSVYDNIITGYNTDPYGIHNLPGIQDIPHYQNVINNYIINHSSTYDIINTKYFSMFYSGLTDTSPDEYELNLNGEKIRFITTEILNQDNSNLHTNMATGFEIINENKNYTIEKIDGFSYGLHLVLDGIKVTDKMGNVYIFEVVENPSVNSISFNRNKSVIYNLKKAISNKGNEIIFHYDSYITRDLNKPITRGYIKKIGSTNSIPYTPQCYFDEIYHKLDEGYFFNENNPIGEIKVDEIIPDDMTFYSLVTSIESDTKKITFSYSNREDTARHKKLDAISIKNYFNEEIQNIQLNYDYFVTTAPNNPNINTNYSLSLDSEETQILNEQPNLSITSIIGKRLQLKSVKINNESQYELEYDAMAMPLKNTYSVDFWGYYNGAPNTSFGLNLQEIGYQNYQDFGNNSFLPNLNYCKAGSLKRIYYPTGGFTEYEYDLHQFDSYFYRPNGEFALITQGGGLRVKSILNYDHTNELKEKRVFVYEGGKYINKQIPVYNHMISDAIHCPNFDEHRTPVIVFKHGNRISSDAISPSLTIGYSKVIVIDWGIDRNYKQEYVYENNENLISFPADGGRFLNPSYYGNYTKLPNGTLLEETHYNIDGIKVLRKKYNYILKSFIGQRYGMTMSYSGRRVIAYMICDMNTPCGVASVSYPITACKFFKITDKKALLERETTTEFFDNGQLISIKNYSYDDYYNIKEIENKTIPATQHIFQRYEYAYETNVNYLNNHITGLLKKNTLIKNGELIKEDVFDYSFNNSILLPQKATTNYKLFGNNFEKDEIYFQLFDIKNNVIQYRKNNELPTSIIWGYGKNYPVSIIKNCEYNTIDNQLIVAINNHSSSATQEDNLYDSLQDLRATLADKFVNGYIFKPGIGIKIAITANGEKTFYTYDQENRLELVKDNFEQIIQEFIYNLKSN